MKASDYIAQVVGAYHPFVVQGGAAIHLIDSLARGGHQYVCCAHEQAAGFAADGFAKMRGFGVAVTTCGPGATNLLTAAASAFFEHVPVLYLVGQQHGFQELDVIGMFSSVTRFAKQVENPLMLAPDLEQAIELATSGSGPVLLNIFDEVYRAEISDQLVVPRLVSWQAPGNTVVFSKPRARLPTAMPLLASASINPYYFVRQLNRYSCQMVTDIGNHGVWVKQAAERAVITDNHFGAMGYAIAASIGVACAGHRVACITGDGSLQMNIQELATIAKHDLDIKIFVLNNAGYGMIRCTQDRWLEGRHFGCDSRDLPQVDFERVATAYGIANRRWETHEDIDFKAVFARNGPLLVNVRIDPDTGVYGE